MSRAGAILLVAGLVMAAPPDSTEPPGEGPAAGSPGGHPADQAGTGGDAAADDGASTEFERRLAEVAFATFLSTEMAVDAGTYSCSEPAGLERGTTITCFTIVNGQRLVVATTTVSAGTAVYDFEVIADTTLAPPEPPTSAPGPTTPADAVIDAHGQAINASAPAFVASYLSDPRVVAVPLYAFDPATETLRLYLSLAPSAGVDPDALAWDNVMTFARYHWSVGQPFRTPGASRPPGFTIVIDGRTYSSTFEIMVAVADQAITMEQWLAVVGTDDRL